MFVTRRTAMIGAAGVAVAAAAAAGPSVAVAAATPTDSGLPKLRQKVNLLTPPFVHEHEQATKQPPKVVEFTLTVQEKKIVIDGDGTTMQAMTFNGSVPGPLMVVHEGDYVELTLINPDTNTMAHNIDFHASTGGLGGGALTLINPGEQTVLRFKATKTGVFVYHCAPGGPMIPWHVVSGMNGAIMVLPREGLKDGNGKPLRYDRIYYVGESDFYIPRDEKGKFKSYESLGDSYADVEATMRTLTPSHVVFNGKVGALTDKNAMTAKVGETVLIVHSQANRDTRPHLIGGHGDYVWESGKFSNAPETGLETWFVRGGSAAAALYTFRQPGIYAYVNHNLIEAAMLGATAHFKVDGIWNDDLMKQVSAPGPIPVKQGKL
jgi:nitrite reductase (NO-forming)